MARRNSTDKARAYTAVSPISIELPANGGFAVTRFMANTYFDVPTGRGAIEPYVGGGIGYATYREKTFAARAFAPMAPQIQLIDDRLHHLAWQAIAGVAVPVTSRIRLTLQGRYLDAGKAKGQDTRAQPITTRLKGLNFDAGVRFAFERSLGALRIDISAPSSLASCGFRQPFASDN